MSTNEANPSAVRRVVVGPNPSGAPDSPVVLFDTSAPSVMSLPTVPGTALVDIWKSNAVPVPPTTTDPTLGKFELMPAGSLFRIIDLAQTIGEPMWHQTDSIDYVYIASGKVQFMFKGGLVDLQAGDTIVVQGIQHAWNNVNDANCRIVCASVAAQT